MLLTYFLNYFEMVPVAPIITGITFVFTFHMRCISIVRSLYFRIIIIIIIIIIKQGFRVPLKAISLLLFENITSLVIILILVNKLLLR
jgi:hypothetical protein